MKRSFFGAGLQSFESRHIPKTEAAAEEQLRLERSIKTVESAPANFAAPRM
jgi:hypothetical protein